MPDKPEATGLAKGALIMGIAGMTCVARQCVRQAPPGGRHTPAFRSESVEGYVRIQALFARRARVERIGDGAGGHAR